VEPSRTAITIIDRKRIESCLSPWFLNLLWGIDPNEVEFHRGPIGLSVLWQGCPIGRINVYAHLGTCTANIKGHEFWVPPNKVIRSWHYNPGLAVPDAKSAKAAVKRVLADARMLLSQTPGADAAEGDPTGPRP